MRFQPAEKVAVRHRVGIDHDDRVGRHVRGQQQVHRPAQRVALAAAQRVEPGQDPSAGGPGTVRRSVHAVVGDHDDLEEVGGIVLLQERADAAADQLLLVVGGDQDGEPAGRAPGRADRAVCECREGEQQQIGRRASHCQPHQPHRNAQSHCCRG